MDMTPDLSGRIALVTGASRGIGYEIARQLGALGAHVVAVARTTGGLEELDDAIRATGGEASLVPLDVKDGDGIDRLCGVIHERWGKLDIMVANAGVLGTLTPMGQMKVKDFDEVVDVNIRSVWRLMRGTDRLLRSSDAGRAIILSSGAAHSAKAYWGPYAASKAAVEALTRSWAHETANTALRVNAVNPGATATRMRAKAMPGEDQATLPTAKHVAAKIVALAGPDIEETGKIFDVRADTWLSYQMPA